VSKVLVAESFVSTILKDASFSVFYLNIFGGEEKKMVFLASFIDFLEGSCKKEK